MENKTKTELIHAVIVIGNPEELKNSKDKRQTRCGKEISFVDIVENLEMVSTPQCAVCLNAARSQFTLPDGWEIVYVRG